MAKVKLNFRILRFKLIKRKTRIKRWMFEDYVNCNEDFNLGSI